MADISDGDGTGSKFKNIRMMFESQGQASPPVSQKPKKISVTAPPKINGNSTTETPETRNRSSAGADGKSQVLRKHPVLTPTDHRANPLATVSNISTDNRLSVPESNRSSALSDISSSEDEAPIVSECDTQDQESDVGEEEHDATYEEEMTKRREETPQEKNKRRRFKIAEELYTTEEAYYSTLTLINETFRNRLKDDEGVYMFPDKTIREIFINTHELQNLHVVLRDRLKDRIENWQLRPRIGDIMKSIAPYFQLYTDYMAKFENAIKTLNEMSAKNENFSQIVKDLEADDEHCQKLKISQHMLGPVQRIPRYRMLLEQYIERLDETSPDYPDVKDSLDKVALAANKANDNITKLENFQLVSQLLSNVSGLGLTLEKQETRAPMVYIKHGKIMKMSRRNIQDRFIFLFSDVILICKIEGHGKYKCNKKIFVSDLRSIADNSDPNMTYPFELITKKSSFILGGKDEPEKRSWMAAFGRVMAGGGQATTTASPQRLGLVAPVWIPDNGVSMCMSCERTFTTIVRRHHCRACGKVYCSMCSSNKQWLAFDNKNGRVCDSCNTILSARDGLDDKTRKTRGLTNSNFFPGTKDMSEEIPDSTLTKGTIQSGSINGHILVKVGEGHYQKYWCVVRGVILHLYAGTYDKKAKKEMPLLGWNIAEPQDCDKVQDVTLTLKVGHQGLDPMFLKFQSESEKEKWYEALEKATFVD
ncbi:FYVE, RhoGEF and PH domain-containing protein 4-like isoform X2 [Bolinopsis microptera]